MPTRFLPIKFALSTILLLLTCLAYSQVRVAVVYLKNGDRLTGNWLSSDDQAIHIAFQDKELAIDLDQISTVRFAEDQSVVPDAQAEKHFRNAEALLELGLRENAKRQFEAAITEYPKYADAHYNLGLLLKEDGYIDEALEYFGRVAKIAPDSYALAAAFKDAADKYISAEEFRKASEAYLLIFDHYPTHSDAAHAGYAAGFLLAERLDAPAKALKILQDVTRRFPESNDAEKAKYIIGVLQSKAGQPEMAVETLTIFIRENLDSEWLGDAYESRGDAYRQLRNNNKALEDYNIAFGMTTDPQKRTIIRRKREDCAWTVYTVPDGLPSNKIQAVAVHESELWVGTPKGFARFDVGQDTWELRREEGIERINSLNSNVPTNVRAIAIYAPTVDVPNPIQPDGSTPPVVQTVAVLSEVWIGTLNQGVIRYNPSTGEFVNYNTLNGLPHNQIFDIEFGLDDVWVATFSGVARYSRSNDQWTSYLRETHELPADDIVALAVTPKSVWVATSKSGMAIYDRIYDSWRSSNVRDIVPEVVGNSIVSFDVDLGSESIYFSWYSPKDKRNGYGKSDWKGLEGKGERVIEGDYVPIEDIYIAVGQADAAVASPPLWIATNDGLYFKSQSGWDTMEYPLEQIGDEVTVNCIQLSNDTAWIGTSNGLGKIDTNAVGSR